MSSLKLWYIGLSCFLRVPYKSQVMDYWVLLLRSKSTICWSFLYQSHPRSLFHDLSWSLNTLLQTCSSFGLWTPCVVPKRCGAFEVLVSFVHPWLGAVHSEHSNGWFCQINKQAFVSMHWLCFCEKAHSFSCTFLSLFPKNSFKYKYIR